jgi:hypothetical protein
MPLKMDSVGFAKGNGSLYKKKLLHEMKYRAHYVFKFYLKHFRYAKYLTKKKENNSLLWTVGYLHYN